MMNRITPVFAPVLMAALFAITPPAEAVGQVSCVSMEVCAAPHYDPGLRQELAVAGVNALLGGVTAAAGRAVRGEPIMQGFWTGVVGGGVIYAGKRIAVEDFGGAGFLGREVASVGGSMIRNASAGLAPFEEMVFPVGPVRLYVTRHRVVPRLDVASVATAAAFVLVHDARLDARESLSAGALIFRGDGPMPGLSSAGTVMVWHDLPAHEGPRLLAHERVHILQYDQAFLSWGERPERRIVGRAPGPAGFLGFLGFFDTGALVLGARTGLAALMPYAARPWEREAYLMAEIAHPIPQGTTPTHSHSH
jgi:hypothetical protein